jgi:hypothetical protein
VEKVSQAVDRGGAGAECARPSTTLDAVTLHAPRISCRSATDAEDGPASIRASRTSRIAAGRPVLVMPYAGKFDAVGKACAGGTRAARRLAPPLMRCRS